MRVVTKKLRLESRSFGYKVALNLSYLRIKFDYEIKWNFKHNLQLACIIFLLYYLSLFMTQHTDDTKMAG